MWGSKGLSILRSFWGPRSPLNSFKKAHQWGTSKNNDPKRLPSRGLEELVQENVTGTGESRTEKKHDLARRRSGCKQKQMAARIEVVGLCSVYDKVVDP